MLVLFLPVFMERQVVDVDVGLVGLVGLTRKDVIFEVA